MKLQLLREEAGKTVTKIVVPGDWPSRKGITIPGSVLPWTTTDSTIWAQSKYTRDVMDDSVQMMQYFIQVPQRYLDNPETIVNTPRGKAQAIELGKREWVINIPCHYELSNIINRPWDPEERNPLPRKLGLILREWKAVNWVISFEHDIADQITTLANWTSDDIEDLTVSLQTVSYFSNQLDQQVRYKIEEFK